jgi:hypothetical protein
MKNLSWRASCHLAWLLAKNEASTNEGEEPDVETEDEGDSDGKDESGVEEESPGRPGARGRKKNEKKKGNHATKRRMVERIAKGIIRK